ncbi:MAG TPA: MEDS domain-containing protein [Armatimonadota bacterium]|nr:MEDS domain-containing protein [Armatimonadota bacterium]
MSTERIPLGFAGLQVAACGHIAYAFETERDRQDRLFAFVAAGLRNHEKCIAAVPEFTTDFWMAGLRSRGTDLDSLPEGQLEILSPGRLLPGRPPDSIPALVDALTSSVDASLCQGWRRTRVCTSFTHLYHQSHTLADLLTAESSVNDFSRDRPVVFLCTFAANRLHPRLLEACQRCHPLLTDANSLTRNHGYLEPWQFADRLPEMLRELEGAGALIPPFTLLDFCGDTPVIRTGDELDIYTAPRLDELADWLTSVGHKELIVDLSGTSFMDAASIGALMRIAAALEREGGRLAIYDPLERPRRVFELSRLHEQISIHRQLDEALRAVLGHRTA